MQYALVKSILAAPEMQRSGDLKLFPLRSITTNLNSFCFSNNNYNLHYLTSYPLAQGQIPRHWTTFSHLKLAGPFTPLQAKS